MLISEALKAANCEGKVKIAMDCAASEFYGEPLLSRNAAVFAAMSGPCNAWQRAACNRAALSFDSPPAATTLLRAVAQARTASTTWPSSPRTTTAARCGPRPWP